MKTKILFVMSVFVILSGCAFSKEDPNKNKTVPSEPGRQGPLAKKEALKLSYQASPEYHKFDVTIEWQEIENCLPQLHRENVTTETHSKLAVSATPDSDGVYRRVDRNLNEGHELRYTLMCLNSASTSIDTKEIQLPFDLVLEEGRHDFTQIAERLKMANVQTDGSLRVQVERFVMDDHAILATGYPQVYLQFKSANLAQRSLIQNFLDRDIEYAQANKDGKLSRSGATLTFQGESMKGHLNLKRRGFPGEHGLDGQDVAADDRPAKNPAKGTDARYRFEWVQDRSSAMCRPERPGRDLSNRNDCRKLLVRCEVPAQSGPRGFEGYMGGVGQNGAVGGSTGKVYVIVKDRTQLLINDDSAGGEGGRRGNGGNGGQGGDPGDPGQSDWQKAVRDFLGMPESRFSWKDVQGQMGHSNLSSDPCTSPTQGLIGPTGPTGPYGQHGRDGLIEPIMIWNFETNTYIEWR